MVVAHQVELWTGDITICSVFHSHRAGFEMLRQSAGFQQSVQGASPCLRTPLPRGDLSDGEKLAPFQDV